MAWFSRIAVSLLSFTLFFSCAVSPDGHFQTVIRSVETSEVFKTADETYRIVVGAPVYPGGNLPKEGQVFVTAIYGALAKAGLADGYTSMTVTDCSAKRLLRGARHSIGSECEAKMFRDEQPRRGRWRVVKTLVAAADAQRTAIFR